MKVKIIIDDVEETLHADLLAGELMSKNITDVEVILTKGFEVTEIPQLFPRIEKGE